MWNLHRRADPGFTLVELLLVVAVIAIIAAIAVPGVMRGRVAANEASAIASMRTLGSSQAAFASTCGGGGFANSLADLGLAPASGAAFIPSDLAAADPGGIPKSGYVFTITGGGDPVLAAAATCNGSADDTMTTFFAQGGPSAASTGARYFATNESGQIRQDTAALPDMLAGTPLQ